LKACADLDANKKEDAPKRASFLVKRSNQFRLEAQSIIEKNENGKWKELQWKITNGLLRTSRERKIRISLFAFAPCFLNALFVYVKMTVSIRQPFLAYELAKAFNKGETISRYAIKVPSNEGRASVLSFWCFDVHLARLVERGQNLWKSVTLSDSFFSSSFRLYSALSLRPSNAMTIAITTNGERPKKVRLRKAKLRIG
jgi:hypothetical protein